MMNQSDIFLEPFCMRQNALKNVRLSQKLNQLNTIFYNKFSHVFLCYKFVEIIFKKKKKNTLEIIIYFTKNYKKTYKY